ncbi:flavodoxin [Candidatus Woesearchaeota archaeon]|nr:flavodoxin [Candidatus Woesearchaeota archaeon]
MKILVAYYTRTNNTRIVAEQIAKILKADLDEIIDLKNRKGAWGYFIAGMDTLFKRQTNIQYKKYPKDYDLVIIGTPTWVGTFTPAIRAYLKQTHFDKLAFFATCGGEFKGFKNMEELSHPPIATLQLREKELKDLEKIKDFCKKL